MRPSTPRSCTSVPRVNRCTYIRALVENDYVINEREAARRTRHGENGQNVSFSAVLLFHFNGTVGSAGTLMPGWLSWCRRSRATATDRPSGRARDQKTGEGIIYRKWVVRRSGVI